MSGNVIGMRYTLADINAIQRIGNDRSGSTRIAQGVLDALCETARATILGRYADREEIRELREQAVVRGAELDKLRGHARSLEAMHKQTSADYRALYSLWVSQRFPLVATEHHDPGDEDVQR